MPTVTLTNGTTVTYAVLIPSKGRAKQLIRTLNKMPWLRTPDTFLGIQEDEFDEYLAAFVAANVLMRQFQLVYYQNPLGSVAVARERLRRRAVEKAYDFYVVTDDNAAHPSEAVLTNLVRAAAEWPASPCIMSGMHNTAEHFDRGKLKHAKTINGLRSYPSVAMIFQCYPHDLYADYVYPEQAFGLDDRHFFLWALSQGVTQFRVCMDAPFTKTRYQAGGQGPVDARAEKTGRAIARLATDFPKYVGACGTLRIPWQLLIDAAMTGGTIHADRLAGGAMRKESALTHKRVVRVRRK
jgi:hypothetical protein